MISPGDLRVPVLSAVVEGRVAIQVLTVDDLLDVRLELLTVGVTQEDVETAEMRLIGSRASVL